MITLANQQYQKHWNQIKFLPNAVCEILIVFHRRDVVIVSFELNVRIYVTRTANNVTQPINVRLLRQDKMQANNWKQKSISLSKGNKQL